MKIKMHAYIYVYYDSQLYNWLNYLAVYILRDLGKYVSHNADHQLFFLLFR